MRIFVLSLLLAISSVNSHAIGYPYRSELFAYSPARGEFPVQGGQAQGYLRYSDANGASRVVGYNFPEPLYGVRRVSYNDLVGGTVVRQPYQPYQANYIGQASPSSDLKIQEDYFRAWCEQRYLALKAEIEKLRTQGLEPSPDMMAQLKPLEKIVSAESYTAAAESPEMKRIREEQLRIWNEERLKVLEAQAQQSQGKLPVDLKSLPSDSTYLAAAPIGETPEQKIAREEHFRIYNEQVLRIKQLEEERLRGQQQGTGEILFKTAETKPLESGQFSSENIPQVVVETPEVLKAKEEHLRLWNEAKLRAEKEGYKFDKFDSQAHVGQLAVKSAIETNTAIRTDQGQYVHQGQGQYVHQLNPVEDTPEVKRAREEHLKLVNEYKTKYQTEDAFKQGQVQPYTAIKQDQAQTYIADKQDQPTPYVATEDAEQLREAERLKEEQRLREEELRTFEAERLRLKQEEDKRAEEERLELIRVRQEDEKRFALEKLEETKYLKENEQEKVATPVLAPQPPASGFVLPDNRKDNPFFLRLAAQGNAIPAAVSSGAYIVKETKPVLYNGNYYLSAAGYQANPFLVRYTQGSSAQPLKERYESTFSAEKPSLFGISSDIIKPEAQPVIDTKPFVDTKPYLVSKPLIDTKPFQYAKPLIETKPLVDTKLPSEGVKIYYGEGAALSELERATKEHFRAHELALEQLRLANANKPHERDCN